MPKKNGFQLLYEQPLYGVESKEAQFDAEPVKGFPLLSSGTADKDGAPHDFAQGRVPFDQALPFQEMVEPATPVESRVREASWSDSGLNDLIQGVREELSERLSALSKDFELKIANDAFRENQVKSLHAELQEYKSDLLSKMLRPYIMGMISLHDNLGRTVESVQAMQESGSERLTPEYYLDLIGGFQDEVELLLEHNGVESFQHDEDAFDARIQQVVKKVKTDDQSLDKVVANRVRKGFRDETRVIQRERVDVYTHVSDKND